MLIDTAAAGRARFVMLACATSLMALAGCGGAASRLQSHMDKGRAYYSKGDFAHASVEFRNALQISPKDLPARLMAAHTAEKLGQTRPAAAIYQSVIDLSADDIDARTSLGRVYALAGAPQEALDAVEPGLKKHPNEAGLLAVRAAARLQTNDIPGARADTELALKTDPANEAAISLRAGLYEQDHDPEGAIGLLSKAVTLRPQTTDLREVLADLYANTGQSAKAEEQLLTLVKLRPADLKYRKALALFYVRAHRTDDAQRTLEAAVAATPKDTAAKFTLADFLADQRKAVDGEHLLRGYIAKDPSDYALRFGLGEFLQRVGNQQGALAVYTEIIASQGTEPKGLRARDRAAAIELAAGADDRALALVKTVLEHDSRDSDAIMIRGQIELKRRDPAASIADLRAVLRDHPASIPVQRLLAQAYLMRGETGLAEQSLRAALDISPVDVALNIELARLLVATNRGDEAIKVLQSTVRQNPDDVGAREALTHAYLDTGQFTQARAAANDLEVMRPKSALGPYLAGLADRGQGKGKFDEAVADFERARAVEPHLLQPLSALAQLELARGNGAAAVALVKEAAERDFDPREAAPVNLLGEVYAANHQLPLAIETLNEAISRMPKWWPPYRNLALAKAASGDEPGAIASYEAAMKIAPGELRLVTEVAALYVRQGKTDTAIGKYEELYKLAPRNATVANNLAMLLVEHRTDRASLDRARDISADFASSNEPGLLDTCGWVRYRRGEFTAALPPLEKAVERSPDNKEFRYHLGLVQLRNGEKARARNNLEAAASGDAKTPWAKDARVALATLKEQTI